MLDSVFTGPSPSQRKSVRGVGHSLSKINRVVQAHGGFGGSWHAALLSKEDLRCILQALNAANDDLQRLSLVTGVQVGEHIFESMEDAANFIMKSPDLVKTRAVLGLSCAGEIEVQISEAGMTASWKE